MIYYFAYGSNMNPNRMANRVGDFEIVGLGVLQNFELKFNKIAKNKNGIGYANVVWAPGKNVEGIIYQFEDIALLDKHEGYPKHYNRKVLDILHNQSLLKTWVYIAQENQISNGLLPERSYLGHLLVGEEYLSESYFEELRIVPVKEDNSI